MGAVRKIDDAPSKRRPPATSPKARERQLTGLAFDLAEKQLRDGTASAQVQVHFLKLASEEAALKRAEMESNNALLEAKREQIASAARQEELFGQAIEAMSRYRGDSFGDSVG